MKNILRPLLLGLATLIAFAHAAPEDDPGTVATAHYAAILNGDTDTAIRHMAFFITSKEIEWIKKEAGEDWEAKYQKAQDNFKQQLEPELTQTFATVRETLQKTGATISLGTAKTTYTNADKTEANVAIPVKGEKKDGSKWEDDVTLPLIKTPQGWKVMLKP